MKTIPRRIVTGLRNGKSIIEQDEIVTNVSEHFPGLIISDTSLTKVERDRIIVIYIVSFFIIFFWAAFEQAGSSLTFIADNQTDRNFFGW